MKCSSIALTVLSTFSAYNIAHSAESFVSEVSANSTTWKAAGVELAAGYVAEITVTGSWHINPYWGKNCGAGGNPEHKAANSFALQGANEGCLLVRVGTNIVAFTADNQTLKVTGPGAISFIANDEPTQAEYNKITSGVNIAGIRFSEKRNADGAGYRDNNGTLKVTVTIRKIE